jgi:hypothetical protein
MTHKNARLSLEMVEHKTLSYPETLNIWQLLRNGSEASGWTWEL